MIEVGRRSFVTGLIALVAAPAIVRAGSLMPVKVYLVVDPSDIAELLIRLEERSELFDHQYSQRYGQPSDVLVRRSLIEGSRNYGPTDFSQATPWVAAGG